MLLDKLTRTNILGLRNQRYRHFPMAVYRRRKRL